MNRYVYCRNNPIKYVDPTGMFVISTSVLVGISIGVLVGAVAGALIGIQTAEKLNITGNNRLLFVAGLGLGGAVVGGVIGSVIGYGVHAAIGAIAGSLPALSATTNALSKLDPHKINHILNGSKGKDHMWYKIMTNVTWDNVKNVIANTMNKGTTTLIGKGSNGEMIYEALMTVKNETVRVSYSVVDGIIKLGDAWVVKK